MGGFVLASQNQPLAPIMTTTASTAIAFQSPGRNVRSTKAINFPVRPPIFPSAFPRPLAAPEMAGPAADETRDRPSEAFDWKLAAVCEALAAVSLAASLALELVDSNRRADLPVSLADCRKTARDTGKDIMGRRRRQRRTRRREGWTEEDGWGRSGQRWRWRWRWW